MFITQDTLTMFNSIAKSYDKANRFISMGLDDKWRNKALSQHQFKEQANVLDLCCGTGSWSVILAKKIGKSGNLTAVDNSQAMLEICKEKCKRHHLENVDMLQADACALPFKNDSFDFVTIGFGLRNIPDKNNALSEIHRVLVPGGSLICLDTSQPPKNISGFFMSLYFRMIMPIIGGIVSKNISAYRWLSSSTERFYTPLQLKEKMMAVNFTDITFESYSGGLVAVHHAKKSV